MQVKQKAMWFNDSSSVAELNALFDEGYTLGAEIDVNSTAGGKLIVVEKEETDDSVAWGVNATKFFDSMGDMQVIAVKDDPSYSLVGNSTPDTLPESFFSTREEKAETPAAPAKKRGRPKKVKEEEKVSGISIVDVPETV